MIKKFLIIILAAISTLAIQHSLYAQETVGLNNVVFEEPTNTTTMITHGFLINDFSYIAVKLHLYIAGKNIETINYQGEILDTIKTLEILTKTDVITMLDLSDNKEATLAKYLSECNQALQKGNTLSIYLKQEMNILKMNIDACLQDKNISDKAYFDAVGRYDQHIMEVSLADSITYETCATQNRIKYNAQASIANKLVFYLWLLQKKYDVLVAKQDIVTKNFTVFRDNILNDLNEINNLLQQYKF